MIAGMYFGLWFCSQDDALTEQMSEMVGVGRDGVAFIAMVFTSGGLTLLEIQ